MIWWLLRMAQSATALVTLLLGALILVLLGLRGLNRRYIGTYLLVALIVGLLLEWTFGISEAVIRLLGKSPTLTDRTLVWQDVLKIHINPILGAGFESFWLGERLKILWAKWWWHPNQAHNGYLETYLNLGLVGLFILLSLILATFRKGRAELLRNLDWGRFRLGFLAAVVAYNWTEASFKNIHPIWFVFYLIAIDYPRVGEVESEPVAEALEEEEQPEPVFAVSEPERSAQAFTAG